MGGIVDVGLRSPKKDGKYHGLAQVDLIDGRVLAEGRSRSEGLELPVGGRRSWVDVWLKPVLEAAGAGVTAAPVYYDYQAFVETQAHARSSLRFGFFGSDDAPRAPHPRPVRARAGASAATSRSRTGVLSHRKRCYHERHHATRSQFSTVASYGRDRFDFALGTLFFRPRNQILLNRTELALQARQGVTLNGGLDLALRAVRRRRCGSRRRRARRAAIPVRSPRARRRRSARQGRSVPPGRLPRSRDHPDASARRSFPACASTTRATSGTVAT